MKLSEGIGEDRNNQIIKSEVQSNQLQQLQANHDLKTENDENLQNQETLIPLNILTPANPIINKQKSPDTQIILRLIDSQRPNANKKSPFGRSIKQIKQTEQIIDDMTLFNAYDHHDMLYRKLDNSERNQLNKKKYFASIFYPFVYRQNQKIELITYVPSFEGMRKPSSIIQMGDGLKNFDEELQFNSNFESGNLFVVFKTGQHSYDLVLQNDRNTTGCTQWFYFSVKNKSLKNILVTFNIVNLYKASSLYSQGMKPMVYSSASGKGWKRKGQNILYQRSSIRRQASKKHYSTLSFVYDFTKQNDTVQFAHSVPYTYSRLVQILKKLETSNKCVVKSLGVTPLKKNLPIVKFQSEDSRIQKKAIIIMARQHAGEVQGSFAIQQILLDLLKPSSEIDFLLWRFNVYIIPMVNVDGVYLGNYRCNSMGYDLNRNWQGQEKSKHPEIVFIKNQIKKIMSKQPIELILDLHGHSNKMNSFFYGNPFGPNPYIFPFAASRICPFISFQDCTFNFQKKKKAKTARCVLGNLIKQTGNVYTYEVSFYGGLKNGKVITFQEQNFRQLGRNLLSAIYKVYVECYKQEKTLKESLYLRQIRKQISKIDEESLLKQHEASDSEAEEERDQMQKERELQQKSTQKQRKYKQKQKQMLEKQNQNNQNDRDKNKNQDKDNQNQNENGKDIQNLTDKDNDHQNDNDERLDKNLFQQKQKQSFVTGFHSIRYSLKPKKHEQDDTQKIQNQHKKISSTKNSSASIQSFIIHNNSLKSNEMELFIGNCKKKEKLQQKIKKQKNNPEKLKIFGQNYLPVVNRLSQTKEIKLDQASQNSFIKVSAIFDQKSKQAIKMDFIIKTRNNDCKNQNFSTFSPINNQSKDDDFLISQMQIFIIIQRQIEQAGLQKNRA